MHTLVLDDNEVVRSILARYITNLGHCCTCCSDSDTAFAVLMDNRLISIVFADIYLDRVKSNIPDGTEFIKMIRSYERDSMLDPCRIIAFSSNASLREKALAAGATEFYQKPITLPMMKQILDG